MRIVIFTGSGVSAESGLKTFRDSDGLWENYNVEDVATPQAWQKDFRLVLNFYDERRKQVINAKPNAAHIAIAKLQDYFETKVITQNIDDLHERAGSKNVLHLHGEIMKARSTANPYLVYDVKGWQLNEGQTCELGSQLRPHIVWFGEEVPELENAAIEISNADKLIVIGTSLSVYPAASLIHYAPKNCTTYFIDPHATELAGRLRIITIDDKASTGVPELVEELILKSDNKD